MIFNLAEHPMDDFYLLDDHSMHWKTFNLSELSTE